MQESRIIRVPFIPDHRKRAGFREYGKWARVPAVTVSGHISGSRDSMTEARVSGGAVRQTEQRNNRYAVILCIGHTARTTAQKYEERQISHVLFSFSRCRRLRVDIFVSAVLRYCDLTVLDHTFSGNLWTHICPGIVLSRLQGRRDLGDVSRGGRERVDA